MQLSMITAAALLLAGASASSLKSQQFDRQNATLDDFNAYALSVAKSRLSLNSTCTIDNIVVRKSWHNLSGAERIAYTDAVLCTQRLAAKTPTTLAAGAKTRYDDFIVTHINQTQTIHFTANFLGWHRFFIHEWENTLRTECGFNGSLPYWDWVATSKSGLETSPIFDGSATSMSGNGRLLNYSATDSVTVDPGTIRAVTLPPGTGGGCVTSGPFVNYTVNLGPIGLGTLNGGSDNSAANYTYNPRCLKRSLTDYANQRFANETSMLTLLRDPQDIWGFENVMQGVPDMPELGVHGGGHWSIGGDPGRDIYTSPGDPAFYLNHGNIDRAWWLWQMQDPATRILNWTSAVNGPLTLRNESAPFGNGTAQDLQNLGYVVEGKQVRLGEFLDPTAGSLCYVYE